MNFIMNWKFNRIVFLSFSLVSFFYRETDVKSLIKNIKKDHKFLRRFMNDIKDYIDIMEGTLIAKRSPIDLQ